MIPFDALHFDPSAQQSKGFSGQVLHCSLPDGQPAAAKIVRFAPPKDAERLRLEAAREAAVFRELPEHPNVVRCLAEGEAQPKQTTLHYFVLERADGSALDALEEEERNRGPVPSRFWQRVGADAAAGLAHLHAHGFVHGDFHLGNVLLFKRRAKICDFGATRRPERDPPSTFCGHMRCSAPECLRSRCAGQPVHSSAASDVFMLGCLLWELAAGYNGGGNLARFFPGVHNALVVGAIIAGERPAMPAGADAGYAALVERCWAADPAARPTAAEVAAALADLTLHRVPRHHTIHLYRGDEVISCLQKAVRRSQAADAAYWAAEMIDSGRGLRAMDRLTVIASEDVSMAVPLMPVWMAQQRAAFLERPRAARRTLLETAARLASTPKCRTVNNCCAASFRFLQDALDAGEAWALAPVGEATWARLRALLQRCHERPEPAGADERALLATLQRLHMDGLGAELWATAVEAAAGGPVEASVRALYALADVGGASGARLRVFHAFMLTARELVLPRGVELGALTVALSPDLDFVAGLAGRHPEGVPRYAADRHTARGKGGGSDERWLYGTDTTAQLDEAAASVGLSVADWPAEERARSHGPARRYPLNRAVADGAPTLLEEFFDEGSWVDHEVVPGAEAPGPMRALARETYVQWEQEYGSLNAKSGRIVGEQRRQISSAGSD